MVQQRIKKVILKLALSALSVVAFSLCSVTTTHAATLSLSPSTSNVSVGNIVSIRIIVGTAGKPINSADGVIQFPANLLEVMSISKNSSIFSLWVEEPKFSNSAGSITFSGGLPTPGFTGQGGEILSITFRAKQAGNASIMFTDASVRQNDGLGTDILSNKQNALVVISTPVLITPVTDEREMIIAGAPKAPIITSVTHPDQNKWYNNSNPIFSWGVPSDVTAIRMQYDGNPKSTPSVTYSSSIIEKKLNNVPDGKYYFHAQFKNSHGWGLVGNYAFNIDTMPPERFTISKAESTNVDDKRPLLNFSTTDTGSGMDHYDVKVGNDNFITVRAESVVSNPYTVNTQESGNTTIVVNAYDKAGNVTTASTNIDIKAITSPIMTNCPAEIQENDTLQISGSSYPNSKVTISLRDQDNAVVSETTDTGGNGNFSLVWNHHLNLGSYAIIGQVTDNLGVKSIPTTLCTLAVKQQLVYKVGYLVINYLSLILILLLSLALIVALIMYSYHKLLKLRRKIRKTVSETEHTLHHRFDQLEKDLIDQLNKLASAKSRRELTKEEKAIFDMFHKYIQTTEKELDTKLEQLKKEAE